MIIGAHQKANAVLAIVLLTLSSLVAADGYLPDGNVQFDFEIISTLSAGIVILVWEEIFEGLKKASSLIKKFLRN